MALSIRVLHPFGSVLTEDGLDLGPLLAEADIARATYEDPEAWITYAKAHVFLTCAMDRSPQPALGLRAARRHDAAQFQALEYLAASTADVGKALQALVRHQGVLTDANILALEQRAEGCLLRYRSMMGVPACLPEYVIGSLRIAARRAAGRDTGRGSFISAWFDYPEPPGGDLYREFFNGAVEFNAPAQGLLFRSDLLALPMTRANEQMQTLLEDHLDEAQARLRTDRKLTMRVETLIATSLSGEPMDLAELSRRLGLSKATLKRRLADEGCSYTQALDRVRHRTAMRLLSSTGLSIGEVAYRTGYKDLSAFNRACRRWTGKSPTEHRKGA